MEVSLTPEEWKEVKNFLGRAIDPPRDNETQDVSVELFDVYVKICDQTREQP
jgi:hypothetical protein